MSKIPNISGKECIKALAKIGYYQKRSPLVSKVGDLPKVKNFVINP
jgi:hypothetical protein